MKRMIAMLIILHQLSCSNSANNSDKNDQPSGVVNSSNQQQKEAVILADTTIFQKTDVPKVYTEIDYVGRRNVILTITESDCNDKRQGDTRSETWSISITGGEIKMKVDSDVRTIDNYTGEMAGEHLHLKGAKEMLLGTSGKATVKLWFNGNGKIEGNRKVSTYDDKGDPCSFEQSISEQ